MMMMMMAMTTTMMILLDFLNVSHKRLRFTVVIDCATFSPVHFIAVNFYWLIVFFY